MRRVTASRQHEQARLWRQSRDAVILFERAIFVVLALDRQQRRRDRGQFAADVPGAEGGTEPDVVPAPEGRVDVVVVARQAAFQVGRAGGGYRGYRDFLDHDVRRGHHQAGHREARRMQQGDRTAVAVAEQPRACDAELREHGG